MTSKSPITDKAFEFRRLAEERLAQQQAEESIGWLDTQSMVHELQVHQIELEMQNEALRQSQAESTELLRQLTDFNDRLEVMVASRTVELAIAHQRIEEAARLHRAILENMADGVHLVRSSDARIVFANSTFERMFGYTSGELLGKHVSSLNSSGMMSPEAITDEINLALGLEGFWRGELCNVRKDGRRLWCRVSISSFEHAEFGQVWVYAHTDVSEKIELERTLAEQQHRLQRALSEANLAMWEWDRSGGIVLLNRHWSSFLGYGPDENGLDNNALRKLIHPQDLEATRIAFDRHMHDQSPGYETEYRLRHKEGHWIWVLERGRVIERDAEGVALRMVGTIMDIGRQKQFQFESCEILQRVESLVQFVAREVSSGPRLSAPTGPPIPGGKGEKAGELSVRQREVLCLVALGLRSVQIAERLGVSTATVMTHRRDIMRKLDLHNAAALTRYALEFDVAKGRE